MWKEAMPKVPMTDAGQNVIAKIITFLVYGV